MKIVCFGDSNTWGYDPRSYIGERYPKDVRWTGLLDAVPGVEVVNCGVNGRSTPAGQARTSAALAELRRYGAADVLIVMLGGNDLFSSPYCSAGDVAGRMEAFLRAALTELKPGRTLLVSPPPLRPGVWVDEERLIEESRRLGPCLAGTARALGVEFADAAAWDAELCFDGAHLTEAGHRAVFEGLRRALGV